MRTDELDFELPDDLIATRPVEPRDAARLLVLSRSDPGVLEDRVVRELPGLLAGGDLLVFNRTRVAPARFVGRNTSTGGAVEGLWLRDAEPAERAHAGVDDAGGRVWVVLLKARRHRAGWRIALDGPDGRPSGVTLELLTPGPDAEPGGPEAGAWLVRADADSGGVCGPEARSTRAMLERVGRAPLPPYIRAARKRRGEALDAAGDAERYQTVFAAEGDERGASVAAPTAGLHFTPRLLGELEAAGVDRAAVTLHVGAGTFKPIEADQVERHVMHREWCAMDPSATRAVFGEPPTPGGDGRRVIAVGSTSTRTIESYAAALERTGRPPEWLATDLMIAPGYRWRRVGGLLTNFHLPRSTLLAMVAGALEPPDGGRGAASGIERVRAAYAHAVAERYRFFSYGDAMLILP